VALLPYPSSQPILKSRKPQKEVLGRLESRGSTTNATAKTLELPWVQRSTTLIAFVTPRFSETTVGTCAFQIAVRKKSLAIRTIRLEHLVFVDMAFAEQSEEYIMSDLSMIRCAGSSE
jgi:hypothetical protein